MDIAAQFGDNFKQQRKIAGLSQDEVGFRASLHRTEIPQIERGLRCPKADTIAKLAGALEVEPGVFFEGISWEPGGVRYGRFVEAEMSGVGAVQRKIVVERPYGP